MESKGLLRVAERRKIRVNVVGTKDVAKFDAAGYHLIHEKDWPEIVRRLNKLKKLEAER